ncbi:SMP-30/gluconolactonase/LRE family protein [Amycolatopsis sp. GM8]|uniref:SMP-30/gluconolactonase/LRE family protein n=1 Tax=Amycolatopsis sp. GM8 TaxID=2896530 RepID=UPI001F2269C0|nr:SMP-30/gluconolactonase/LRE family protein [Amycolatopsis sp. GM8]
MTRLVLDGLCFAEGPRWHEGRLWVSDVFGQRVLAVTEDGAAEEIVRFPGTELPVGLGFLPDGRLLISNLDYPNVLRLDAPGQVVVHADLSRFARGVVNDMVVDPRGRAYVGAVGLRDRTASAVPGTGAVILVEPDGSARMVADDMVAPNGPCLTPDGCYVVAELPARRLTKFDRGPDGSLHNRRVFAELSPFTADGISADAEGAVWTSSTGDGVFRRIEDGGAVTDVIKIPGRRAVACCLGGADGRTLFLLSNGTSEIAQQWARRKFHDDGSRPAPGPPVRDLARLMAGNSRIDKVRVRVPGCHADTSTTGSGGEV